MVISTDGFASPVAPVDCIARKEKKNARNSANKISPTGIPNWLFMTTHAITSTTINPGSHIHVALSFVGGSVLAW